MLASCVREIALVTTKMKYPTMAIIVDGFQNVYFVSCRLAQETRRKRVTELD